MLFSFEKCILCYTYQILNSGYTLIHKIIFRVTLFFDFNAKHSIKSKLPSSGPVIYNVPINVVSSITIKSIKHYLTKK